MSVFPVTNEFALVVPALQRRAHNIWIAVERERARVGRRQIKASRHRATFGAWRRSLQIGTDLVFALWAILAVAFCLVVAFGFLR